MMIELATIVVPIVALVVALVVAYEHREEL